jgi:hypothetical protein
MPIFRNEIFGSSSGIGEIAATAARDEDLFSDLSVVFDDKRFPASLRGLDRTEQSGRAPADNDRVERH